MIELVESFFVGDDLELEFHKFETIEEAIYWIVEEEFKFVGITGSVWIYKKDIRMAALNISGRIDETLSNV